MGIDRRTGMLGCEITLRSAVTLVYVQRSCWGVRLRYINKLIKILLFSREINRHKRTVDSPTRASHALVAC